MMFFFSLQWLLAGLLNMINAFFPRQTHTHWRDLYDFLLGAMLGVHMTIFIHYGIGFFVPAQEESVIIRYIAISLNVLGSIIYLSTFTLLCYVMQTLRAHNLANSRRLVLVSQL